MSVAGYDIFIKRHHENLQFFSDIEKLIKSGVTEFIFGSKSEFDDLSYQIVSKLKEKYPNIIRIFLYLPSETGITILEEKIRLENALCKQLHKKD